jgi:hypothetical protein
LLAHLGVFALGHRIFGGRPAVKLSAEGNQGESLLDGATGIGSGLAQLAGTISDWVASRR